MFSFSWPLVKCVLLTSPSGSRPFCLLYVFFSQIAETEWAAIQAESHGGSHKDHVIQFLLLHQLHRNYCCKTHAYFTLFLKLWLIFIVCSILHMPYRSCFDLFIVCITFNLNGFMFIEPVVCFRLETLFPYNFIICTCSIFF